jgi:hypothetical protein
MFWANWNCLDRGGTTGEDRAEVSAGYESGKWYSVCPRLVPKKPVYVGPIAGGNEGVTG